MKKIEEYQKSVTIYLLVNPRAGNSLKIEFDPKMLERFAEITKQLRQLGFSCSVAKSVSNYTQEYNIIDMALPLYIDEKAVVKDLVEELEKVFGENSVLDRTTIKRENKK